MKPQLIAVFVTGFLAAQPINAGDPSTRFVLAVQKTEKPNPEITRLFAEARKLYDSGRYELAYKRYEQILDLDPNCSAARKGQEEVDAARITARRLPAQIPHLPSFRSHRYSPKSRI